jgi:hypothetical protein
MTSYIKSYKRTIQTPRTLIVKHNAGFFSCCSVRLDKIVEYYNKFRRLPDSVDSSQQFSIYKPAGTSDDITNQYFAFSSEPIKARDYIYYSEYYQYINYKTISYEPLLPFIRRYFSPSTELQNLVKELEIKYGIDYDNTCVLFHRGNDKSTETVLPSYEDFIKRAKAGNARKFLIQSDETEFIEQMLETFPNTGFCFKDEIRHMKRTLSSVDKVFGDPLHFSKYYLAITIIMSKCNSIICGSGNCSMWIMLYRGHARGVQQFLKGQWLLDAAPA